MEIGGFMSTQLSLWRLLETTLWIKERNKLSQDTIERKQMKHNIGLRTKKNNGYQHTPFTNNLKH